MQQKQTKKISQQNKKIAVFRADSNERIFRASAQKK